MRSLLVPSIFRRGGALPGAVIVCAVGVLAAACGSQGPAPAPQAHQQPSGESTPPPISKATSPADAAGQQAKAAYLGMWEAMAKAGEMSDWKSPELGKFATDNALTTITRSLYTDHFNHVVTQGRSKNNPQVTSVEPPNAPETVMLSDCGDSSGTVKVFADSRKPTNDKPGGRQSILAEVKKQPDGTWRVTRFAVQGVGTC